MLNGLGSTMDLILAAATTVLLVYLVGMINKLLVKYLAVPLVLMWVHVAGSLLQDQGTGPEWVQNHMHNLGAPAVAMLFGLMWMRKVADRYMMKARISMRYANTKAVMTGIVKGWTIGVLIGCGIEVLMITTLREDAIQQGYSGAMDWVDISAYLTSEVLILINYRKIAPKVLRETARTERRW